MFTSPIFLAKTTENKPNIIACVHCSLPLIAKDYMNEVIITIVTCMKIGCANEK
jgi:hypothetical protein